MTLKELYAIAENIGLKENEVEEKDLLQLSCTLYEIVKRQNKIICEFKNDFIRLSNNLNAIEGEIDKYIAYKNLCDTILYKVSGNPISVLKFIYSLRKNLSKYNK